MTIKTVADYRKALGDAMPEADLQREVIRLARMYGWRIHHSRPSIDRSGKWSTAITGDRGLPDLILVHNGQHRILFRELKREKGRVDPEQRAWMDALLNAGVDTAVWRPRDLLAGRVAAELAGGQDIRRPV